MSGHLELYRTTVNLRGLGSGTEIEIDPTDEAWGGDIRARRIVRVGGAVSETYLTDREPDCEAGPAPDPLGHDRGPAPEGAAWRGGGRWMDAAGESGAPNLDYGVSGHVPTNGDPPVPSVWRSGPDGPEVDPYDG